MTPQGGSGPAPQPLSALGRGPLSTDLRNQLGRTIAAARREAEAGARRALESLAVGQTKPHESMSPVEQTLRNRLRARGRQLGDVRKKEQGTQNIDHLAHEVAYEHWHRMLFARLLAENGLLIEPDSGVPISMQECDELAREAGEDPHAMAARFAQAALPQIFRTDDPVLDISLAPETRQALERLLDALPREVFTADDSLGWTYQYWQTDKKDAVNASGVRIGGDELPAVTQLFTEHYMVQFLFHNTIGAWWAGKVLAERPELAEAAETEEELRQAARLSAQGGYDFSYLRFVREPQEDDEVDASTGPWRPAAGTYDGWPGSARQLKVLDPCCGSGHFLVEGFELLVRLRMEEEGLVLEDAMRTVLSDNLHGLELDPRCTQIAAFNLAVAAWKLAGQPFELPELHIACSGLGPNTAKEEWLTLAEEAAAAGGMPVDRDLLGATPTFLSSRIREGLGALYDLFQRAPELGSLIDPRQLVADTGARDMYVADLAELAPVLERVLDAERQSADQAERVVAAHGMARAAELLAGEYTLVITNVPYLARGKQSDRLREFADRHYRESKADLATVFVSRVLLWLGSHGTMAVVTPQNWLFLTSYRRLREGLLERRTINAVALLGSNAFQIMNWWAATTALVVLSASRPHERARLLGLNAGADKVIANKAAFLAGSYGEEPPTRDGFGAAEMIGPLWLHQSSQLNNPDSRITLHAAMETALLREHADVGVGFQNGDSLRLLRSWWEIPYPPRHPWTLMQSAPATGVAIEGCDTVVYCDQAFYSREQLSWHPQSVRTAGRESFAVRNMGRLPVTRAVTSLVDQSATPVAAKEEAAAPAIWAFLQSNDFRSLIRQMDHKVNVTPATFGKVPFDLPHWHKIAAEKYPNGLPEPHSDDPTQWLCHGHPAKAEPHTALQVAVARLLGYRWPPELDLDMRLSDDARAWVQRCSSLAAHADPDGIVCLNATRGEAPAADRLRQLLAAAFGADWSAEKERQLLAAAAGDGKPAGSLEEWLRDSFFTEHCKLFHHRPFVWHIWDGRKDGFHALVNYHRLAGPEGEGHRTLQAITYSYLGDWVERQRAEQREGREGADGRLAAAQDLHAQLEKILAGEPPCDLFIRWKPLHEQPIGWEPDINDGVRLNIRPFMSVELRTGGRKGAGILRWKPNINWKKDRGKEPESLRPREEYPWFWSCPGDASREERTGFPGSTDFDGNRWNDLHYTVARKQATRTGQTESGGGGGPVSEEVDGV